MAEDGIEDYAAAKRKAARQAGVPETRQLPTNEEIEAALRLHHTLYGGAEQEERVQALRSRALEVMRGLERFNPYLTGSVLAGTAGKYADINLQLYTEHGKDVELFLIGRGIGYRVGERRLWCGDEAQAVPTFTIHHDGVDIEIAVLGRDHLRVPVRTTVGGKPLVRARTEAVEALLAKD